jgi:ketosteroid isomerase-like protein
MAGLGRRSNHRQRGQPAQQREPPSEPTRHVEPPSPLSLVRASVTERLLGRNTLTPTPELCEILTRTMSQENVDSFRRGLEAGNRGDVETLLEELDPEVEWHSALHALLGGEQTVFRGHDGIRDMLRDLNEAFDEIHIEISEIRDLGDRLVAIGRTRTRGKASGAETDTPLAFVTTVKNGKTISLQAYLDPKQALAAVGLSEHDAPADG